MSPPRLMLPREVQSRPGRQVGCPRCPLLPFPFLTSSSRMKRGGPGGGLTRGITQIIGPGLGVGGDIPHTWAVGTLGKGGSCSRGVLPAVVLPSG